METYIVPNYISMEVISQVLHLYDLNVSDASLGCGVFFSDMDSAPLPFLGRREDSLGCCGVSEEFVGTTAGGTRFVVLVGAFGVSP